MPSRITNIQNKFSQLKELMKVLRQECPWDKDQDIHSLRRYTLEETHEVLEAIEWALQNNDWQPLKNELGDLLLQIAFYACLAEEQQAFDFEGIVDSLVAKMIYRHPHVFGDAKPKDLTEQWESLKDKEHNNRHSLMDGIPPLPALSYAQKQQQRAARVGFDWVDYDDVIAKMREEIDELAVEIKQNSPIQRLEDEFGDVLFTLVNLARKLGLDAELCLMSTNRKFAERFRLMESNAQQQQQKLEQLDTDSLEQLYQNAKLELQKRQK
ncbi:MAG: nucleoside triphosphate pyrophosphohydrolase [Mariprofundaceae bacterium]